MVKTLLAKAAVVALAAGVVGVGGATVASAAVASPAAPRSEVSCAFYLAGAGYKVGPKVTSACTTAAHGFPTVCEVGLEAIHVSAVHARKACALGAQ
ncbi:hypothetical protein VSH64_22265 [Amycolatopsis rhabdoformis]|uniref:Uncharacterized protein n=1 Tax=Amycolatopsis rhabdoformis TaxID=1448059 RepID=A0ABZ1IK02_9PSEU|nr:hypothetical protein [Amycolatopsis rhabdoformis]WSE34771.1 hypothetical protein VSH64_22265 [Amycolatopsis rhabdoformis]